MMVRSETQLDPKTEAVLARLCERLGFLNKTQAVKLPYLVDVMAQHLLGRRLAATRFEAWDQGVVAPEIYRFLTYHSEPDPVFRVEPAQYSESAVRVTLHGPAREPLAPEEREIVDLVANEYGRLPVEQLGRITKRLNTELGPEDWGTNAAVKLDEDSFLRLSPHWQDLYERIAASDLDDRRLWSEPIGDPGEYLRRALA
jgi:uncharacterized phage-associated protein